MRATLARFVAAATVVAALALPLSAAAQTRAERCRPRGINAREHRQQERIRAGVRSGELTRAEAARLEAEQARIRVYEAYARRSGGELTARERLRLERSLNHSSRDIYRQKHDGQDRN
ncbi:MAG TPA: hypothetical protein VF546_03900 [Pyrinomonadaceae bacterium]|jgi:hypothetical protein